MTMERLSLDEPPDSWRLEAAIHLGRYALALPFASSRRALDVGCGSGYGARLLVEGGVASLVGVDVSADALHQARGLGLRNARFEQRPAEAVSEYPACSFDLVTCFETIEHVEDPGLVFEGISRVAADDAIVLISCPNDHWYYGPEGLGNPFHKRRYTFEEFRAASESHLGPASNWLLGAGFFGYVSAPAKGVRTIDATPRTWAGGIHSSLASVLYPSGDSVPTPLACGYFLGAWGPTGAVLDGGSVCGYSIPMDSVSDALAAGLGAGAEGELAFLRARVAALDEAIEAQARMIDERDEAIRSLSSALDAAQARE